MRLRAAVLLALGLGVAGVVLARGRAAEEDEPDDAPCDLAVEAAPSRARRLLSLAANILVGVAVVMQSIVLVHAFIHRGDTDDRIALANQVLDRLQHLRFSAPPKDCYRFQGFVFACPAPFGLVGT